LARLAVTKNRCIVPATAFCEYADGKPRKIPTWFAMAEDRPLFASPGYGHHGAVFEGQRVRRSKVSMSSSVS
jgi:putative SOS response-associated peptidase YedK